MFRRFAKRRNCLTLRERHSADLPLKPSLAYTGTRRSSFAAPRLEWRPLAHMTQSTVKGHNGPADRLQSVGGACR